MSPAVFWMALSLGVWAAMVDRNRAQRKAVEDADAMLARIVASKPRLTA
jgi:hypothetical protein